ncbi:inosine-5-monophosphate dehydrogenase, putative [Ricinus communis]|uniref:Inosine-5-monophosphate dehydrogenase, putative n=1 Tax=Ricinus communis TaxID=3988 RepID=B9TP97_RICCO|nr:inosine-5-monophosphate dehydrogenase, putative [Ricinus communis]
MAGGGAREIGDLAFYPDHRKTILEQLPRQAVELADAEDIAGFDCRGHRSTMCRLSRTRHLAATHGESPMLRIVQEALTFDDVLLVPSYSEVTAKDVSLKTRLTRNIELNIPLVSAAMDTVTEARLAIALAQEGGIGIIHKSMGIEAQAREVRAVKKHESGVVKDPITIDASAPIRELIELRRQNNISGVPVLDKAIWSASSPAATCVSKRVSMRPSPAS